MAIKKKSKKEPDYLNTKTMEEMQWAWDFLNRKKKNKRKIVEKPFRVKTVSMKEMKWAFKMLGWKDE